MKLSEAIKLGSMLRPQAFGRSFDGIGTCAWGAADEAMGIQASYSMHLTKDSGCHRPMWAWTKATQVECPHCYQVTDVAQLISRHLNDDHQWTRERIANWIATIEPQEVVVTEPIIEAELVSR